MEELKIKSSKVSPNLHNNKDVACAFWFKHVMGTVALASEVEIRFKTFCFTNNCFWNWVCASAWGASITFFKFVSTVSGTVHEMANGKPKDTLGISGI